MSLRESAAAINALYGVANYLHARKAGGRGPGPGAGPDQEEDEET